MIEVMEPQPIPYNQGKLFECKYCDNTGRVYEPNHIGVLDIGSKKRPCPVCHGSGYQRI
jgi:DnaJ-class molecular chaperone